MTTKSISKRTKLAIRNMNRKIALYIGIELYVPRIVGMQNKLLDFMGLQIQNNTIEKFTGQRLTQTTLLQKLSPCQKENKPAHQIRCPSHE